MSLSEICVTLLMCVDKFTSHERHCNDLCIVLLKILSTLFAMCVKHYIRASCIVTNKIESVNKVREKFDNIKVLYFFKLFFSIVKILCIAFFRLFAVTLESSALSQIYTASLGLLM